MQILLFTAFLLFTILLIDYFWNASRKTSLKILKGFGILIGFLTLGLNSIIDDSFGASTPTNIVAENRTDANLKIYVIAFWKNGWNGNFVTFDKELKPNEKSDFWFENDGTEEFWIVAKTENEEIKFLDVVSDNQGEFFFGITENTHLNPNHVHIAKDLTIEKDKSLEMEKYAVWTIYALIGLLFLSMLNDLKIWWRQHVI